MSHTAPIEGVELEDFIRGRARLEHAPDDVDAVVRALSLPDADTWRRAELGWRARVEENAQLARIVKLFVADYMRELRPERPDGAEGRGEDDAVASERQPVRPEVPSYLQGRAAPEPPAAVAAPAPPPGSLSPLSANPPAARARGAMPVLETEPVDLEKLRGLLLANPTPFVGKALPERPRVGGEENRPQALPSRRSSGHETMMLSQPSQPSSERVDNRTLPFAKNAAKAHFPELSVDHYAAFAAEVQAKGASSALLARYGITSSQAMVALHLEQERRFAASPEMRARFEERKAHFLSFMKPVR